MNILIIIFILSMVMAINKEDIKANNKPVLSYPKRVFSCFIAFVVSLLVVSWFIFLPILGLIYLL